MMSLIMAMSVIKIMIMICDLQEDDNDDDDNNYCDYHHYHHHHD
jgi:hypothetical protein